MRSAWRAELTKVATVKGQWIGAALAAMSIPLVSLLVVATGGLGTSSTSTWGASTGSLVGMLGFGIWSATLAAGEYATQTVVVSLTTVPRRPVLFGAKLLAAATVAGIGTLLSTTLALVMVLAVTPGRHSLGDPVALTGVVVVVMAVAALGAAVGVATRSPSASIVIVAVALLLPKAAGGLLGWLQPWIVGASPGTVVSEIVGGQPLPSTQLYPAGVAAAAGTMALVVLCAASAAGYSFVRRDG